MFRIIIAILAYTSVSAQAQYSNVVLDNRPIPAPITIDPDVVKHLNADPLVKHLNTFEKEFLYWTNYSRINPRRFWDSAVAPILSIYPNLKGSFANSLKETLYKTESLPLLSVHHQLQILAKKHAVELGKNGFKLSHTSPNGTTFQQRMNMAGIEGCAGENLTLGQTNPLM